jgi:germination protein M
MKKKMILTLFLLLFGILVGCSRKNTSQDGLRVYYRELSGNGISSYIYKPSSTDQETVIDELWTKLTQSNSEEERISLIPSDLKLVRSVVENSGLELYFDSSYQDMDTVSELLFRAGVVKTFCQVDGIESVTFFVDEKPLTNSSYAPLGAQTASDYVDIVGNGLSSQKKATLTLYYANEKGDALVKKIQDVVYESSYSIEKDVINRLIQGPFGDGYFRTLPANLQLISIGVKDKICYVNFDSSFLTDALSIDGNLIVYSIVNSLTELADVQRVQIMVDGDSNIVFRDISLGSPLERNLNY